jgi:hypothetical protein
MVLDTKYLSEKYVMLLDVRDLSQKYIILLIFQDFSSLKTTVAVLVSLLFTSESGQFLNITRSRLLFVHKSFGEFSFTPSVPFQGHGSIKYPKYPAHGLLQLGHSTHTTGSFMKNMVSNYSCALQLLLGKKFMLKQNSGPVVRVAPNELSFIGDRAWDGIYGVQVGDIQS